MIEMWRHLFWRFTIYEWGNGGSGRGWVLRWENSYFGEDQKDG